MKVIVKYPSEERGHYDDIPNTLEALQKAVCGHIEAVGLMPGVVVLCDEEGKFKKKRHNCTINGENFVGVLIVAGTCGEEFCDVPINLDEWKEMFR